MQPMRSTRAAGMLVFTTLAWGAMFAVAKTALGVLDAFWLSLWRYVPAALLMVVILRVVEGRRALSFDGAGVRLWLYGSLGFAGFSILGFLGLSQSRPEHAAIIVALMPLITSMINWAVRGHRPSPLTFGAIVVALAGVVLVITHGPSASGSRGHAARGRDGAGRRDLLGRVHDGCGDAARLQRAALHGTQHGAGLGVHRHGDRCRNDRRCRASACAGCRRFGSGRDRLPCR